jgi:prevent-host-death family protein
MLLVPVSELKAKLSEYLRAVGAGKEVLVESRGRPIAILGPVHVAVGDEVTLALVHEGLARPPRRPLQEDFWARRRPEDQGGTVRAALIAERDER